MTRKISWRHLNLIKINWRHQKFLEEDRCAHKRKSQVNEKCSFAPEIKSLCFQDKHFVLLALFLIVTEDKQTFRHVMYQKARTKTRRMTKLLIHHFTLGP